jgi:hypothetical protein
VQIGILAALIAGTAKSRGAKNVIDVGAGQVCISPIQAAFCSAAFHGSLDDASFNLNMDLQVQNMTIFDA